jgi:hypothetical protein
MLCSDEKYWFEKNNKNYCYVSQCIQLLTPWSRVLPEKLKRPELLKKFPAFYGTRRLSSSLLSKNVKIKIYRTIILPVVLYGCESLSLTFREECRLRVFENRVLRRIFGP